VFVYKLMELWKNHCQDNLRLYFAAVFSLILGIVLGALTVKTLSYEENSELAEYINIFLSGLPDTELDNFLLTQKSLTINLRIIFLIWFLGLTVVGAPLIMVVLSLKGFILGFTVGFFIQERGLQGILLSIFSFTPPNLLILPALITAAVLGISFSSWLFRGHFRSGRWNLTQQFMAYSFATVILSTAILGGAFIEAYFSPLMLKLLIAYF
jgi:stage II sporulation protein M